MNRPIRTYRIMNLTSQLSFYAGKREINIQLTTLIGLSVKKMEELHVYNTAM